MAYSCGKVTPAPGYRTIYSALEKGRGKSRNVHMHGPAHCGKLFIVLPLKDAKSLVRALVIGRIDYCNAILFCLPPIHVNRLQRIQNAATRSLTNTPRYSHITTVLINLHWLPVKFRIIFKVNLMTFKPLHGLAPAYLSNIISFKGNSNYNLRSNFSNLLAHPAIRSAKATGDRAFSVAAPFFGTPFRKA